MSSSSAEKNDLTPLFSKENDDDDNDNDNGSMAELFKDKIRALLNHFDKDGDEHLNFKELAALQKATEGVVLSEEMYLMACKALNCKPQMGISLPALKLTYASDGASFEKDYYKVFPEKNPKKDEKDDQDKVYEIGDDGAIDISS